MVPQLSPTLLKILSSTVLEVEQALKLPKSDPALRELKQAVLLALGELEMKRTSRKKILLIKPGPEQGRDPVEREERKDPSGGGDSGTTRARRALSGEEVKIKG